LKKLNSGFRRNDGKWQFPTFYEFIRFEQKEKSLPTFREYAESTFMTEFSDNNHKESTQESYRNVLKNHIYPAIGEMPLDRITKQDIKNLLIQKKGQGYTISTINLIKAYTSSIFEYALGDDEIIESNPVRNLGKRTQELLKNGNDKKEINPYNREELIQLLDTVQQHLPEHYPLFLLLARTGMRAGEALGLKWEDFDFNSRFIEVNRQYSKGKVTTPKNGKSRRVDMSLQLAETLKEHPMISENVFINTNGGLIDLDNWRRRVFNKAL
jgi:integrase